MEIPGFPYNTLCDRWKDAPMAKTSLILVFYTVPAFDRQTRGTHEDSKYCSSIPVPSCGSDMQRSLSFLLVFCLFSPFSSIV